MNSYDRNHKIMHVTEGLKSEFYVAAGQECETIA